MGGVKTVASLIIFVLLMCGVGYCQEQVEDRNLLTVDGTVVSVDAVGSKIVVNAEVDYTFTVTLDTVYTRDIYDIYLSDLKPGDYVNIEYYDDSSGKHIATHISVDYGPEQS